MNEWRWATKVLLALSCGSLLSVSGQDYCLARDNNPYLFFATNTAYEFVYEKRINHRPIPGCKAVQMWMTSRHGTSYPNRQTLSRLSNLSVLRDRILSNHDTDKNGKLCHEDLEALREWSWRGEEEVAEKLSEQGRRDMIFLAKRLKTNFPSIFGSNYSPNSFSFKFSGEEVARESAQAFAEELLGHDSPVYLNEADTDPRLSTENCSSLRDPEIASKLEFEVEKFRQSPLALGLVSSVSFRLGFLYNLTLETLVDMYDACGYEKAWDYSKTSAWCAVFTKRDLKVLEYMQDLKEFYKSGYGNRKAVNFGCFLVKNLIETFKKAENEEADTPSGVFYWGNEALLEAVMSRLGIADDKRRLPASISSLSSLEKRQWRTAFISPFAGNVAAIFYKCTSGESNQVMFYINEHTVEYEGCHVGLCSWQYLKGRFTPVVSHPSCSYEFCDSITDSAIVNVATPACLLMLSLLHFFLIF